MAWLWPLVQLWLACIGVVVAAYFLNLRAMNAALFAPAMAGLVLLARTFL